MAYSDSYFRLKGFVMFCFIYCISMRYRVKKLLVVIFSHTVSNICPTNTVHFLPQFAVSLLLPNTPRQLASMADNMLLFTLFFLLGFTICNTFTEKVSYIALQGLSAPCTFPTIIVIVSPSLLQCTSHLMVAISSQSS